MRLLPATLLLVVVALSDAACGVGFRSAPEGNEFFKSAKVTGNFQAGGALTGAVTFKSSYPVEIQVLCEIRRGKDLVQSLDSKVVPLLADGSPKKTPVAGAFSYDFTVADPGAYKFECYTAVDQDNYIIREFTVRPTIGDAPVPTPAPTKAN